MPDLPVTMIEARTVEQVLIVRELFQAYAESLDVDLEFQQFEAELAGLPGPYAPPTGRLLFVVAGDAPAGCVGLKKQTEGCCEMKRMYVLSRYRGKGLGRLLAVTAIATARHIGYERMRLDSLPSMYSAQGLYRSLGFQVIAPYYDSPVVGTVFMELDLKFDRLSPARAGR